MLVADASVRYELASMKEWGFVVFPRAEGVEYTSFARENVVIIPSSYSTEEADDIAFAYAHWTQRIPAYCDGDSVWQEEGYSSFKDHRAVDETLWMMKRGKNQRTSLDPYVPGLTDCLLHGLFDPAAHGAKTPADALKDKTEEIDRRISDYNAELDALKHK